MTAVPDVEAVAAYLGKEASDPKVVDAYAAEVAAQASTCRVEPYVDDLGQALKRRVARNLAMRGVPLGVQMSEVGGTFLGRNDPEVRRLEAPYRKLPVG